MKKILIIILGICLLGIITAVPNMTDDDFTEDVTEINTEKLCEAENGDMKKCKETTPISIDTSGIIQIVRNPQTGLMKITAGSYRTVGKIALITQPNLMDLTLNVWSWIRDKNSYITGNKTDYKKFYGYTEITDKNNQTTEGVDLVEEVNLLRQAIWELKTENTLLRSYLCELDGKYC